MLKTPIPQQHSPCIRLIATDRITPPKLTPLRTQQKPQPKLHSTGIIQTRKRLKNKKQKKTLIYYDTNTQSGNIGGSPLCQATKQHLNNSYTVKNVEKKK